MEKLLILASFFLFFFFLFFPIQALRFSSLTIDIISRLFF
jgi:hypothetical protein